MSSDVQPGIGEVRTTQGSFKTAAKLILYSLTFNDTAAGVILCHDSIDASGAVKAVARLGAAGGTHLVFPRGVVFSTACFVEFSTTTAPHVAATYE